MEARHKENKKRNGSCMPDGSIFVVYEATAKDGNVGEGREEGAFIVKHPMSQMAVWADASKWDYYNILLIYINKQGRQGV